MPALVMVLFLVLASSNYKLRFYFTCCLLMHISAQPHNINELIIYLQLHILTDVCQHCSYHNT